MKKGRMNNCLQCNHKFYVFPYEIKLGNGKFCSSNCSNIFYSKFHKRENHPRWKGGIIDKLCGYCGNLFTTNKTKIKNGQGKYCSKSCSMKDRIPWNKGGKFSIQSRKRMSISKKKLWQDKEYREKQVNAILKGLLIRPTSLEQQMIDIIKKNNLPYKYTGNGDFWIGGKNPDFVNINGEKKLIEVANTYINHHPIDYSEKRKIHFAKYGWESFIFIENRLDERKVLETLKGGY